MKSTEILGTLLIVGLVLLGQFGPFVQCANIMFFFGISSYSHRISVWPLVEQLAERGHKVTFVSPFPSKNPNPKVTDYVPQSLKNWVESWNETSQIYDLRRSGQVESEWFNIPFYGIGQCEVLMGDPEYVKWTKESKFDLVIIDSLCNECAYGMAYKFRAKIIVFNTANPFPWYSDYFGFALESSSIPDMIYHYPFEMNLYQRIVTSLVPLYFNYLREFNYFPKLQAIMKEKLDIPDLPSFSDIERNVSLLLLNHHFAEDFSRPLPPNVISVGGMQVFDKSQKLTKELEDFIKKGGDKDFIYMSFGSYAELSVFPKHIQDVFINTMKKLKNVQIIWKTEMERPSGLTENVFVGKWMPQQAILFHPKIRAFITHSGLLGIHEAIGSAVPLVAFPIYAEQDYNAEKIHSRELGIRLDILTVTEEKLLGAINKILTDEKYARNMKHTSKMFQDRPAKPVDTAVWWTEYVLRHDDMSLIKPQSIYQSWWKTRNLDVWAILFGIIFIAIRILFVIAKVILKFIFRQGKTEKVKNS